MDTSAPIDTTIPPQKPAMYRPASASGDFDATNCAGEIIPITEKATSMFTSATVSVPVIKAREMVFAGIITSSAGTAAVSIPTKFQNVSANAVANTYTALSALGFMDRRWLILTNQSPTVPITISGNSLRIVMTSPTMPDSRTPAILTATKDQVSASPIPIDNHALAPIAGISPPM